MYTSLNVRHLLFLTFFIAKTWRRIYSFWLLHCLRFHLWELPLYDEVLWETSWCSSFSWDILLSLRIQDVHGLLIHFLDQLVHALRPRLQKVLLLLILRLLLFFNWMLLFILLGLNLLWWGIFKHVDGRLIYIEFLLLSRLEFVDWWCSHLWSGSLQSGLICLVCRTGIFYAGVVCVLRVVVIFVDERQVIFLFVIDRIEIRILCRIAITQDNLALLLQLV